MPLATSEVVVSRGRSGRTRPLACLRAETHRLFVLGRDERPRGFVWVDMARASNVRPGAHRVWAGAASGQAPCQQLQALRSPSS